MSSVHIGQVAPFPPLPGQPYPPARNHPRWKELYRLHDEWLMKYWPFSNNKKRARIPFMNLAGFSTWCAPAADFDRMVWGARIAGVFFLADDYVDSGKMLDRIPGFKKAATGTGPLHHEDQSERCHDVVFRAIKATCHPRTFEQLTKCTHEWWDSNIHEPFQNLDQYLKVRRVNIAMYFANAYFRYTLDINLTDEQVNHPLMRDAEGIISDHVGLVNDLFSYAKERLTNSDDTNIIRILQEHEGLTYEEAIDAVKKKIRQKELDFIPAGLAVLRHPELGKDPEVHRWISCLPYCMGGNLAWSQESGRYNLGSASDIPFPYLPYELEPTPLEELVDDSTETTLREKIFNAKSIPPPDFTLDVDPLEAYRPQAISSTSCLGDGQAQPIGIAGMITIPSVAARSSVKAVSTLLVECSIEPGDIGRIDVISPLRPLGVVIDTMTTAYGALDISIQCSSRSSGSAFFDTLNWFASRSWDGRKAVVVVIDKTISIALLLQPNAPIIIERLGSLPNMHLPKEHPSHGYQAVITTYTSFEERLQSLPLSATNQSAFDFLIQDCPSKVFDMSNFTNLPFISQAALSYCPNHTCGGDSLVCGLAWIIKNLPPYDLFDKRIAAFSHDPRRSPMFFALRILGDTSKLRSTLNKPFKKEPKRSVPKPKQLLSKASSRVSSLLQLRNLYASLMLFYLYWWRMYQIFI